MSTLTYQEMLEQVKQRLAKRKSQIKIQVQKDSTTHKDTKALQSERESFFLAHFKYANRVRESAYLSNVKYQTKELKRVSSYLQSLKTDDSYINFLYTKLRAQFSKKGQKLPNPSYFQPLIRFTVNQKPTFDFHAIKPGARKIQQSVKHLNQEMLHHSMVIYRKLYRIYTNEMRKGRFEMNPSDGVSVSNVPEPLSVDLELSKNDQVESSLIKVKVSEVVMDPKEDPQMIECKNESIEVPEPPAPLDQLESSKNYSMDDLEKVKPPHDVSRSDEIPEPSPPLNLEVSNNSTRNVLEQVNPFNGFESNKVLEPSSALELEHSKESPKDDIEKLNQSASESKVPEPSAPLNLETSKNCSLEVLDQDSQSVFVSNVPEPSAPLNSTFQRICYEDVLEQVNLSYDFEMDNVPESTSQPLNMKLSKDSPMDQVEDDDQKADSQPTITDTQETMYIDKREFMSLVEAVSGIKNGPSNSKTTRSRSTRPNSNTPVSKRSRSTRSRSTCPSSNLPVSTRSKSSSATPRNTSFPNRRFQCAWSQDGESPCNFQSAKRYSATRHVRVVHFKLPETKKSQLEQGIVEERDPLEYVKEKVDV